ncbi:MAG: small subunit ribosomal protein S4, partial [Sediminicola sp.]
YGILERQFANLFDKAQRKVGITGELLLQFCEARLDNVVYRMGVSPTRSGARQLVGHRHITVNGNIVNIPSYSVRPGDKVGVRERSKSLEIVSNSLASSGRQKYDWIDFDRNALEGTYVLHPTREQIPENIKEQLIVELYSK